MKLNLYSNNLLRVILIILSILILNNKTNLKLEDDLKKITLKLRCMTCQNQSIYDSDADFSLDIKKIIRQKLEKNETEKEIIDFLIYRFGEYITFKPIMNRQNIFLWIFPFTILAISLVFLIFRIKKN